METKKKLRKDITALRGEVEYLRKAYRDILVRVEALEADADTISGKETAEMLGWKSSSVKSEWLESVGIEFKIVDGRQRVNRASVQRYIEKKKEEQSKK